MDFCDVGAIAGGDEGGNGLCFYGDVAGFGVGEGVLDEDGVSGEGAGNGGGDEVALDGGGDVAAVAFGDGFK